METKEWYGAKTVYEFLGNTTPPSRLYEERIIVLQAESFDDAISIAEQEAAEYSDERIKYLGYVNVFKLYDEKIENKTEVFSLLRTSDLEANNYLNTFFVTGSEHTQK